MAQFFGALVFIWLILACIDQGCNGIGHKHPKRSQAQAAVVAERQQAVAAPIVAAAQSRRSRVVSGHPAAIIVSVSRDFDVPAGALYGVWMKESGGLASGWGSGKGWLLASGQTDPASECRRNYKAEKCQGWWQALQVVCSQRRRDGAPVCDPDQVRTSYALAMGPMQILPTMMAKERPDGSFAWTDNVVDYDGDGVADPHNLADALAMAAKIIRRHFEEEGDWVRAVNRYYGSQTHGYFEGTDDRLGVVDYWQRWCAMPGNCRTQFVAGN